MVGLMPWNSNRQSSMLFVFLKEVKRTKAAVLFHYPKISCRIVFFEIVAEYLPQFTLPFKRYAQVSMFDFG